MALDNKKSKLTKRKILVIVLIVLAIGAAAAFFIIKNINNKKNSSTSVDSKNISYVFRGDVVNELTSSGSLSPKDTYTITSLVSGEILSANFEKGEEVTKDQVLYEIDQSDMSTSISSYERKLQSAIDDEASAKKELEESLNTLNNGTILSTQNGYVVSVSIKAGDTVGTNNTVIGQIKNDTTMTARIPFLSQDADKLKKSQNITVQLADTGEELTGRIDSISQLVESEEGGVLVKYIEVVVENPGGLRSSDSVSAYTDTVSSIGSGKLEAYFEGDLKAELPCSAEIDKVLVKEGQHVSIGTPLFTLTADSLEDALETVNDKYDQAKETLLNAEESKDKLEKDIEKYTITAPISGQVIQKYMKEGDNISTSQSQTSLALIYDLSELTFEMSIDELDIVNVEVGQEVEVTADAFEGVTYKGHVSSVGLNGTQSNGVTTYPVVVTLDEKGDLLPGMNVDGKIILEKSEDTLYIPVNALQRGNIVYVKDSSSQAKSDNKTSSAENTAPDSGSMPEGAPEGMSMPENAPEGMELPSESGNSGAPDGFTAVKVETGIISEEYAEIISGLTEGQEVYVKDSEGMTGMFGMMGMGGPGGGMGGGPGGGMGGGPGGF